ncbi:PulJ/GspJ family protein [Acetobacter conturbans]|nr:type II secretion system protein [Acetobacter conturbans]
MCSEAPRDGGFTLLEVIIALMIAGSALAVMFSSLETGLWSGRQADVTIRAVSVARSQLEATLASLQLHPGTTSYVVNGQYHSSVEVRQVGTSDSQNSTGRLGLYSVSVTVGWGLLHHSVQLSARAVRPSSSDE